MRLTSAMVRVLAILLLIIAMSAATASLARAQGVLFAPGVVSTGFDESHITFDPDGETLYFLRNTPDFMHWTVLTSRRRGTHWSTPTIAPFSGTWSDADVFITHDRRRLFFVSNRPRAGVTHDDTDIWTADRVADGWSEPRRVDELSSDGNEWFPTMTNDGTLYFGSERPGGAGRSDLWRARWIGDRFAEPENLGSVFNTADQEIEPLIAPDERWLIFAARGRTPSSGAYDLYISHNCPSGWSEPRPLSGGVNSEGWDFAPRLSLDGRHFFITSNRALTSAPFRGIHSVRQLESRLAASGNGLRDIYMFETRTLDFTSPC